METKPIDILTEEEWYAFQKQPYERDFEQAISRLEGPRISSEEDINKIWSKGGFLQDGWSWHEYKPTDPDLMLQYVTDLLKQTDKKTGDKICDIGIGTSFVQAVFAALGFKTYGVDESDMALEYSPRYHEAVQEALGFEYQHQPVNAKLDINTKSNLLPFEFSDGVQMKDMDAIFFNVGDSHTYAMENMKKFEGISPGTIWLSYFILYTRSDDYGESVLDTPFRPIDHKFMHSFLVS